MKSLEHDILGANMPLIEKPELLDAKSILAISADTPEKLFPRDEGSITRIYRILVARWHPDRCHDEAAGDVALRLNELREKAIEKLTNGTWQDVGYFTCRLKNGKTFRVPSDVKHDFDLGTLHIGRTTVTYVVKPEYADLFKNALKMMDRFRFADDKMKKIYASRLPTTRATYEAEDALILTVKKNDDEVLLRDLLPQLSKDNRNHHVAWMISRMHEIVRLLDFMGLTHNAITLDTLFVSPKNHTLSLLGGWWYASPIAEKLKYVTPEALDFLPDDTRTTFKASPKIDLEMVKAAGRELLGDRGGTSFTKIKPAPDAMVTYLRQPSSAKPQVELERWYQHVLPESFGARRFIELPLSYSDIYQPGG